MKIKSYIKKQPVTVKKSLSVSKVACKMDEKNLGTVFIVDKGMPVGIITESDIVRRVVAKGLDPEKTTVDEVMTGKPYMVKGTDEVGDVYHHMLKNDFRHAPVVKDRKLCGLVSLKVLAQAIEDQMLDAYFGKQDFSGRY